MSTPKKRITNVDWEEKLDGVELRKEDMNKLVMDFLVTEGYVEVAKKFRHESNTERIDLAATTARMEVKKAVLSDHMENAIETVKNLNQEIQDTNPEIYFKLQQQQMIELIQNGKIQEALNFAEQQLIPMVEKNHGFLEEFEKTAVLLAFEDMLSCPVSGLLDISRRFHMANEINTTILSSQGHEKDPKVLRLSKMLEWVQNQLDQKAVYPLMTMSYSTTMPEDPAV